MSFTSYHLYYDDLDLKQIWESPVRTITEADVVNFAGFSGDFNPIHIDHEFAKTTPFRRPIAHGFGIFSIASGLSLAAPATRIVAMVGVRDWLFASPVFIGDTIHIRSVVIEKTLKGRGKRGEVVWQREILNQDNKVVQHGIMMTLVECRPLVRPGDDATSGVVPFTGIESV